MKQHILRLFRYNFWSNNSILNHVLSTEFHDDQVTYWLNHILNIEEIWFDRIHYGQSSVPVDRIFNIENLTPAFKEMNEKYRGLLRDTDEAELDRHRNYINSKEIAYINTLKDILTHVLNHSTYHRAQIVYRLQELGQNPPDTNYIYYLRELDKNHDMISR